MSVRLWLGANRGTALHTQTHNHTLDNRETSAQCPTEYTGWIETNTQTGIGWRMGAPHRPSHLLQHCRPLRHFSTQSAEQPNLLTVQCTQQVGTHMAMYYTNTHMDYLCVHNCCVSWSELVDVCVCVGGVADRISWNSIFCCTNKSGSFYRITVSQTVHWHK